MKIFIERTAESDLSKVIALVIDDSYLILQDNHRHNQCHHLFSDFEISVAPEGPLESKMSGYGDRAKPIYMGDHINIQL